MEEMVEIYKKYMPQVYKFLFSLCHDVHLSEELTQETFFQAMKSIDNFHGDCRLYVWLCSIAKHLWYKELKKKKRETAAENADFTFKEIGEIMGKDENWARVTFYRGKQKIRKENRHEM